MLYFIETIKEITMSLKNIIDTVEYIRNWEPTGKHAQFKDVKEESEFYSKKIAEFIQNDQEQCDSFAKLMATDIKVDPRIKNLPSLVRIHKLLKKEHQRICYDYGMMRKRHMDNLKWFNRMNGIDGHFFAAVQDNPYMCKVRYMASLESKKWVIPPDITLEELQALFCSLGDKDLMKYAEKCMPKHVTDKEITEDDLMGGGYKALVYFGRSRMRGRPLFGIVDIPLETERTPGIMFPKNWKVIYVSIPNNK